MTRFLLPLALGATLLTQAPPEPALADVLASAGAAVSIWEREMTGLVAEERYTQSADAGGSTDLNSFVVLRSDLSLLPDPTLGWVAFRDVYEVNSRPVGDRDSRLVKLFEKPNTETLVQAKRIAEESARFNIRVSASGHALNRTINTPMMIVRYVRPQNQARSSFKSEGVKTVNGAKALQVRFAETGMPRLIKTEDDAPAYGLVWIDVKTGRILRGELNLDSKMAGGISMRASVAVDYGMAPKINVWVPLRMEETSELRVYGSTGASLGRATYANFRQFSVSVSDIIKR